jgi:Protein of unknown function (DUF3037)
MRFEKDSLMARSYSYAIIRLAPDDARNERINIGMAVFDDGKIDIRTSMGIAKVRAISGAIDPDLLRELIAKFPELNARLQDAGIDDLDARLKLMRSGPLVLSQSGTFIAESAVSYEDRIASILKAMVDPEPAPRRLREKRSKVLSQVKKVFRRERVLARKDEDISSHRIVSNYELAEGLTADLLLRNGAIHVVETVDATGKDISLRRTVADIGVAALVLEQARMKFEDPTTKARLVYNVAAALEHFARPSLDAAAHQGTELTNWASAEEQKKFVSELVSLAVPLERSSTRVPPFVGGQAKLH